MDGASVKLKGEALCYMEGIAVTRVLNKGIHTHSSPTNVSTKKGTEVPTTAPPMSELGTACMDAFMHAVHACKHTCIDT